MSSVSLINGHIDDDVPRRTDAEIIKALADNEIEKALKCCQNEDCYGCSYFHKDECTNCLTGDALDLINRQKAEYEDLYKKYCELAKNTNERVPVLIKEAQKSKAELRAEAIKEFAERLKDTKFKHGNEYIIYAENIDNLVKEMAGATE